MSWRRTGIWLAVSMAVCSACAVASPAAPPLRTAVFDPGLTAGAAGKLELRRMRAAGATMVRIDVNWAAIAPAVQPAGFDASDPADENYRWSDVDELVRDAFADGLQPLLDVTGAPTWAEPGRPAGVAIWHPAAADLSAFAHALARRYAGTFEHLPRVQYWQLWNEPNLNGDLQPQFVGQQPVSPAIYRSLLNAFTTAIKGVHATNFVIAGGLAPYGIEKKGQPIDRTLSVAPMTFLRGLFCLSAGATPRVTCNAKVKADAFAVHPYTWGGPTHTAYSSNDVAIGDLPEVEQLLADAWKHGRIVAHSPPTLWITEFSWDTNPPDPNAISTTLQARWTAEALYHMWTDRVAVVTWFLLRDMPLSTPFQSGLFFRGASVTADRPKPTLTAFRFPFVAYPRAAGTFVWGRTPSSRAARVLVQEQTGSRWRTVATLAAGGNGIFEGVLGISSQDGYLRAVVAGSQDRSLPFGLASVPDKRISPFGG